MAKSLRSKWRRKCKAIKRERYAVKELARLKKTLGIDDNAPKDVEMSDLAEIATVVDAKKIKKVAKAKQDTVATNEEWKSEQMEVEGARVYNKKTLRDQYGNYPEWMSHRKILKHKKGRAKTTAKISTKTDKRPKKARRQKKATKQKQ